LGLVLAGVLQQAARSVLLFEFVRMTLLAANAAIAILAVHPVEVSEALRPPSMQNVPEKYLSALRLGIVGFVISLLGVSVELIDRGNPEGGFFIAGSVLGYIGLVIFLAGLILAIIREIEAIEERKK
jgi:hypothetical protein